MEQVKLELKIRNEKGSQRMKDLRKAGLIPGIVYGEGEPVNVKLMRRDFDRIMREHQGESVLLDLLIADGDKVVVQCPALMKDRQYDPVSDFVVHLDFLRISMDKEISVKVPVVLKGEAIGLKKAGATLEHLLRELEVVCLPSQIPHHIELDVSHLDIHTSIHAGDIVLPEGVRTKVDANAVVVTIVYAIREVEAQPAAEGAAQPELQVIKEKPKEEKAAAAAKPAAGKAEGAKK